VWCLGRKVLGEVATVARPDTILAWYRKLVARKFDGSKARQGPGRPRVKREVEQLIVRMVSENRDWGYDRIVGALANLGYEISDQTVGQYPAPRRTAARAGAQAHDHLAGLHSDPSGGRSRKTLARCSKSGAWVSFLNYRFFRPFQFFDHTGPFWVRTNAA
jgi:hypothetical protein